MASKRKKRSTKYESQEVKKQYTKVRRNLQAQLSGLTRRGYMGEYGELPVSLIPKIPKKVTQGSVRALQKFKRGLTSSLRYYTDTGEAVSYKRGRQIERKKSSERAKATRKLRKRSAEPEQYTIDYTVQGRFRRIRVNAHSHQEAIDIAIGRLKPVFPSAVIESVLTDKEINAESQPEAEPEVQPESEPEEEPDEGYDELEQEWQREQSERDQRNKKRMSDDERFRQMFSDGQIIYDRIEDMISSIESEMGRDLAKYARDAWNDAKNDGREELYLRLAKRPDVLDTLESMYYKSRTGDHFNPSAYKQFVEILQGSVMSAEETQDMMDKYERSTSAFDIDEGIED